MNTERDSANNSTGALNRSRDTSSAHTAQQPSLRSRIFMQEVATRDGFQNESQFIETEDKIRVINSLSECGFAKIEVTSFN